MRGGQFPKRVRLLRADEFERVFAVRASAANSWMALHGAANQLGHPRIGLVVSRRVGDAVQRNRWKRLLREAFRLTQGQLPPLDLACIPRSPAPPSLVELQESLMQLAARVEQKTSDAARRLLRKAP